MGKIRVLHIIKTLNLGGAEANLFNLVNAMDRDKFDVHVAYSYGGEIELRFKKSGVRLFKYADGNHRIKSLATFAIVYRLARYILRNDIDIVHTHIFNAHVWGLIAAKLTGRRVVEHVHDFRYLPDREFRRRYGFNNQYSYVRFFRNASDIVVVLTRQNRNFLVAENLYPQSRIREIHNGIPVEELRRNGAHPGPQETLRQRLGIAEDAFVILTLARMSQEKNIDLIFRTAPKVIEKAPQAVFLVSGNGPLLEDYRARAFSLGLERHIRFIGFYEPVRDLLAVSQAFLLPSFLELHSISLLEAMSMQVPVIISKDVGCHNDFVQDWRNGVLLDPFSDAGWAEAVVKLINEKDVREGLGRAAFRTCVENFDITNTTRKIENVYAELACR